jgi:hypothetical protein
LEEQIIDIDGQVLTKATNSYGRIEYHDTTGQYHRLGGPARIWPDGYQDYWIDDKRHRTDGPAVIHPNGAQQYWVDGKLHRIDGPAEIYPDGTVEYWVNDIHYTEDDYPQTVINYKLKQLVG